ncbi:SDR family oxidoreductase [Roseibium algae]|uniref:SDR family oxidoreductase n=1 Tax=Roseibium algae TaxID=3123038 RepID=A0ABU8THQ0_9HYPH
MTLRDGCAVVVGSSGGVGGAVHQQLLDSGRFLQVLGFHRNSNPALDLLDEASIQAAARAVSQPGYVLRLVVDATGVLAWPGHQPEKSLRALSAEDMAHGFAVNAIGPALLMKHFLPLLPKDGKAIFATLSARVGSISDNHLGGWYSYRASKAALNQLVRTAAIELRRKCPEAICLAVHPGTVATNLSESFAKQGLSVQTPEAAAKCLLLTLEALTVEDSGQFLDHNGQKIPW